MELPLLYWSRMSELTADRAGFLACQDIETVISTEMKLAGAPTKYYGKLDTKQFIKQSKEFKGFDFSSLDKIAKMILIMAPMDLQFSCLMPIHLRFGLELSEDLLDMHNKIQLRD